jgi:FdhE protein
MAEGLLKETERLMEQRPLAREILTVFRDLAALMTEASPLEKETHLDDRLKDIKREEGFPLFSREDLPVDLESAAELLGRFLTTLRTKERPDREGLQRTLEAFNKDNAWSRRLFSVILKNDEGTLSTIAAEVHLDPQTLKFLAQIALTPSLRALRRLYADQVDADTWGQGYCPFCGSGPDMAFLDKSGKRHLHCGFCGEEWPYPRLNCPFCRNDDHGTLGYFHSDEEKGFRVDFCRKCERYIKTVDRRVLEMETPMELENLATLHLDIIANQEGFK